MITLTKEFTVNIFLREIKSNGSKGYVNIRSVPKTGENVPI